MADPEKDSTLFADLPEPGQVDGRGDEADPGPQNDAGREVQVLKAVGDYFATKRKRR